tara:strand:- start:5579 stop:5974 length:396 start_codon:yes stop_codon:yes gene_type:complete
MSIHRYNSWGRTRRPKAASGRDGDFITGSTLVALNQLGTGSFSAENGCYRTENQRYAHIACSGSSAVSNVFAYNYAMGFWHELVEINPNNGNKISIAVGNNQMRIIDINGADWVAITSGSNDVVTMAFSTF